MENNDIDYYNKYYQNILNDLNLENYMHNKIEVESKYVNILLEIILLKQCKLL